MPESQYLGNGEATRDKFLRGDRKWVPLSEIPGTAPQLIVPFNNEGSADSSWSPMPVSETFLFGDHRHVTKVDLTNFTQVRLVVNSQGNSGSPTPKIKALYKTSFSTTLGDYSGIGTSEVSVVCGPTVTLDVSSWIDLASAAKADVFIALSGLDGNGLISQSFGSIALQFR